MDLQLNGMRALVAGGSAGLGAATARALADEGARVVVAARPGERLERTAAELEATPAPADLATPHGPAEAVRAAVEALDGLDLLLVNAGGPPAGTFGQLDEDGWQRALDLTFWSSVRLVREALPHLREGRDASVLFILSSTVREPIPALVTSNVLRPGLAGLVKTLAFEEAPIRFNGIAPGRFATERVAELDADRAERTGMTPDAVAADYASRIPLGRYGDPDELGRVAAFLLSPAASYVSGVILSVDGGQNRALP